MHFVRDGFSFPETLSQALQDGLWSQKPAPKVLDAVGARLAKLWPVLAKDRGQRKTGEAHYAMELQAAEAYAAYYLPANLMKPALVLEEAHLLGLSLGRQTSLRWMDVGAGPGTALWGVSWWAAHRGCKGLEFLNVEPSKNFSRIGKQIFSSLSAQLRGLTIRSEWETLAIGKDSAGVLQKIQQFAPEVLSFVNSLSEFDWASEVSTDFFGQAVATMRETAERTGKTRWLLFIEPGSLAAGRDLLALREKIKPLQGTRVWLPCLDARPCGALAKDGDWCHEECACEFPDWHRRLGEGAGLKKEQLLFSYLLVSVGPVETPAAWPLDGFRVVSQRLEQKGQTACFLCTKAGKTRARVLHSKATAETEGFLEVSRGEIYNRVDLDEKGSVLSFERAGIPTAADEVIFPKPGPYRR